MSPEDSSFLFIHNLHGKMHCYCHIIMSRKLCALIKTQATMYHREQNEESNFFLR